LKSKVRKEHNRRKLGVYWRGKLKQLSKQLLGAKKSAQEKFLKSILSKEGKCWSDFYKYVKRRKENKKNIPAIKDCNGQIISDAMEKANTFNSYYSKVFSSEGNILYIQGKKTDDPFSTDFKRIKRRIKMIGKTNQ
jgi:hypothetical protein